jgi:hypothetical protein
MLNKMIHDAPAALAKFLAARERGAPPAELKVLAAAAEDERQGKLAEARLNSGSQCQVIDLASAGRRS